MESFKTSPKQEHSSSQQSSISKNEHSQNPKQGSEARAWAHTRSIRAHNNINRAFVKTSPLKNPIQGSAARALAHTRSIRAHNNINRAFVKTSPLKNPIQGS